MRALVVYESMFGNTERVAEAVAAGLTESAEVVVAQVGQAPAVPETDVDLVVVGGPTHAFSMSRPSTRQDAVSKGASRGGADLGLREWVAALPTAPHTQRLVTFDTRVASMRHLPGSAARAAAGVARRHGYRGDPSESFYVDDVSGPLLEGELERAREWGRSLARTEGARPGVVDLPHRRALVVIEGAMALFGLGGGVMLVAGVATPPVEALSPLGLSSWVLPGLWLTASVAVPSAVAAVLAWRRHPAAPTAVLVASGLLAVELLVQVPFLGVNALQGAMALVGATAAALAWRGRHTGVVPPRPAVPAQ